MADTSKPSDETVAAPSNGQAAPVTPSPDNAGGSEVEKLKAQIQAQMRANQLANQELEKLKADKEARDKAEADAKAQELEDNQQYKTLAETERAKREQLEASIAATEKKKELTELSDKTLADFSDKTRALAKDLGLSLADVSDEAVQDFRTKLEAAQAQLGDQKVTSNNGNNVVVNGAEPTGAELFVILNDPVQRDEYYRKFKPMTADMMGPAQP